MLLHIKFENLKKQNDSIVIDKKWFIISVIALILYISYCIWHSYNLVLIELLQIFSVSVYKHCLLPGLSQTYFLFLLFYIYLVLLYQNLMSEAILDIHRYILKSYWYLELFCYFLGHSILCCLHFGPRLLFSCRCCLEFYCSFMFLIWILIRATLFCNLSHLTMLNMKYYRGKIKFALNGMLIYFPVRSLKLMIIILKWLHSSLLLRVQHIFIGINSECFIMGFILVGDNYEFNVMHFCNFCCLLSIDGHFFSLFL